MKEAGFPLHHAASPEGHAADMANLQHILHTAATGHVWLFYVNYLK